MTDQDGVRLDKKASQDTQDTHDQVMPEDRWEFDSEVAAVFDNMLARSIPQYDIMREVCFDIATKYEQPDTAIIDLGCSRGEAIAQLVERYGDLNYFVGVEVSDPMLEACRSRFKDEIEANQVDIRKVDLKTEYPDEMASVTMAVLTIQFTPIEYRQQIVRNVYKHTIEDGAFILVEKVIGGSADIDSNMVDIYYDMKRRHGYSDQQIERKRLSLEGVLVPVTARWNEELLRSAGFSQVDCFWRWMNFAAWVAVK